MTPIPPNRSYPDRLAKSYLKRRGVVALWLFFLILLAVLLRQAYISMPWDSESSLYLWRRPLAVGVLSASLFGVALGIGSLLWWMISWISGADWSTGIRRTWENIASASTIAWISAVCVFCIMLNSIYPWAEILHKLSKGSSWVSNSPETYSLLQAKDFPALAEKLWWMNQQDFIFRALAVSTLFIIISMVIRKFSVKADLYDHTLEINRHQNRMTFLSGVGLPLLLLCGAIIGIDWVMLVNEHWVSSIFPLYILAFAASLALAASSIIAMLFRKWRAKSRTGLEKGRLGVLLLVALSFKIYFGYSQYMIMDYAAIPDEQLFMQQRMDGVWQAWTQALLYFGLALPLALICIPALRNNKKAFAACCGLCLIAGLAEAYWLIAPNIGPQTAIDSYYICSFIGASTVLIIMMSIALISLLGQDRIFARDRENEIYKHH